MDPLAPDVDLGFGESRVSTEADRYVRPALAQPQPERRPRVVQRGRSTSTVTAARLDEPAASSAPGIPSVSMSPAPAIPTPWPRRSVTPIPDTPTPQKRIPTSKLKPLKDDPVPSRDPETTFTITEVGLSSRQVWVEILAKLARNGLVSPTDQEARLRP